MKPEPCAIVICGATGDLARTTLLPSLYALYRRGLLPEKSAVVGFARKGWDDAAFREAARGHAAEHKLFDEKKWAHFAEGLSYVQGDFTAPASKGYAALRERLGEVRRRRGLPDNVLFHLSTAPRFYSGIVHKLREVGLHRGEGWRRVVVEKPFGRDRESARELDRQLLEVLGEERLYRVDHYLGKETVQNMLAFRFANPGFEAIWNRDHIDHVLITAAEEEGIAGRADYYDHNGAVRDMMQNHLLHLLCITAMEPPAAYDAVSFRDETAKVLRAVRPPDPARDGVLGQYGPAQGLPGYREEEGVPDDSATPTFAALRLAVANWRWAGVPFFLRTGKRLPRKLTEIRIHFRPAPHPMFPVEADGPSRNMNLTFRLSPGEGIIHTFLAKQPGPEITLRPVTAEFYYAEDFGVEDLPDAYEWLLHDALLGDQTLFPRADWIDRAWSVVDPVIAHGESHSEIVRTYTAGTWGPEEADRLASEVGRQWVNG